MRSRIPETRSQELDTVFMTKNLLWKVLFIVATVLFFLFGILGIPKSFSPDGLLTALTDHIHLGLDLKGGTHLILQVKVNDAVKADSQQVVDRMKEFLRNANINYSDVTIEDPVNHPETIALKGVSSNSAGDLRNIVQERLPEYDLKSGGNDTYSLTMKAQSLTALKQIAVTQAIETIRNRIDALGVTEPTIQEHGLGEYQILVQLPGVDDPERVKAIVQSTAMLEIRQAMDNGTPYQSEQAALQAHNGVLPPDTEILKGRVDRRQDTEGPSEAYYIITKSSAVSGRDLRNAQPGQNQTGRPTNRSRPLSRRTTECCHRTPRS